ncbi:MAG TPA: SBBP repeat-containing protein, partial [bacterium]|nr:SBBP repeat-containing protein [bacterium]
MQFLLGLYNRFVAAKRTGESLGFSYKSLLFLLIGILLACAFTPKKPARVFAQNRTPASHSDLAQAKAILEKVPLYFERNLGQTDHRVEYLSRGSGYTLFFTPRESVLAVEGSGSPVSSGPQAHHSSSNSSVLRVRLHGVGQGLLKGAEQLQAKADYFIGNDSSRWKTGVPLYSRLKVRDAYPGIDMVYYGNQGKLEYDFVVHPGADPRRIRMDYEGASQAELQDGNLVLRLGNRAVAFKAPVVYQESPNSRKLLKGRYVLAGTNQVSFVVDSYDRSKTLVIDPVLDYSSYLGGMSIGPTGGAVENGMAMDASGNVYITGYTQEINFPTTTGALQTLVPNQQAQMAIVVKINPSASGNAQLAYATYLGGVSWIYGQNNSSGNNIAVDASGHIYVAGWTNASTFPTTSNAYQPTNGAGTNEVFVTELDPSASGAAQLVYSTFLLSTGGGGFDLGMALDSSGNIYLAGDALSGYPTTSGAYQTTGGVFVAELNPTLSGSAQLVYSTRLGGTGNDYGRNIAVDGSGHIFVSGYTTSLDFPTTSGAYQTTYPGSQSCFAVELNPAASGSAQLVYSTYLGPGGQPNGMCLDPSGNIYLTGTTTGTNFPTSAGAYLPTPVSSTDGYAFVSKINPSASGSAQLAFSTYLAGNNGSNGNAVTVDSGGNIYVTGNTYSTNFPTTSGAYQTTDPDVQANHVFVTKLNPALSGNAQLVYSTYIAGVGGMSSGENAKGIGLDSQGRIVVVGYAQGTTYPSTAGAYQSVINGGEFPFVSILDTTKTGSAQLVYSTYVGGGSSDAGLAMVVDSSGNIYLTGSTSSTNFPLSPGAYQSTFPLGLGNSKAFVVKLNPSASGNAQLVFASYLGGNATDLGQAIAVDATGKIYVAGTTRSSNFPVTGGALQATNGSAFITKLDPSQIAGGQLVYSSYFGGTGQTQPRAMCLDASANVYLTGYTLSSDFPKSSGAFQTSASYWPAFATKLNLFATGSAQVVFSTYINGSGLGSDYGNGIAVDGSGNIYVTGQVGTTNFPTTGSAYQTIGGIFVCKFNPALTGSNQLVYGTLLGGSGNSEAGQGIAVDGSGVIYVAGQTNSSDITTTTGAYQTTPKVFDAQNVFLAKLNPALSGKAQLLYMTYFGSSGSDNVSGLTVDSAGRMYVVGTTNANDFPATSGAYQTTDPNTNFVHAFVSELNPSYSFGDQLIYSTYLGANGTDNGNAIAVDGSGNVYVAGYTTSADFPTTANAYQTKGIKNAFVAKLDTSAFNPPTLTPTNSSTRTPTSTPTPTGSWTTATATSTPTPGAEDIVYGAINTSTFADNLYLMDSNGGNIRQLTNLGIFQDPSHPQWSPDRSRICYELSGSRGNGGLYIVNADGTLGPNTNLAPVQQDGKWSPDGNKITGTLSITGSSKMYILDVPSATSVTVLNGSHPSWAPDGSKIMFADTVSRGLETVRPDGTGIIAIPGTIGADNPFYSPDGTRVLFTKLSSTYDIWIMNQDGSAMTNITNLSTGPGCYNARWSPDGSKIAYDSNTSYAIYVINPDGSGNILVGAGVEPSWSPDSLALIYRAGSGPNTIVRVNRDGTGAVTLNSNNIEPYGHQWASLIAPQPLVPTATPTGTMPTPTSTATKTSTLTPTSTPTPTGSPSTPTATFTSTATKTATLTYTQTPISLTFCYYTQWGTLGAVAGQFIGPYGVAVNSSNGYVYVSDSSQNDVQAFDGTGNYQNIKFGSYGTGFGQFSMPRNIYCDSAGNVYVPDWNSWVQKFSSTGTFLLRVGTFSGNGHLSLPDGVWVDSSGNIYVADTGNNRIAKFDSGGNFLLGFGTSGSGNGQFNSPADVAVDPWGQYVYVTDNGNNRIQKFDSNGNFLAKWGTSGTGNSQFNGPQGVATDCGGNIYVVDSGNKRVEVFDSNGSFITQIGSSLIFNSPIGISVDQTGNVYVADGGLTKVIHENLCAGTITCLGSVTPTSTPTLTTTSTATNSPTSTPTKTATFTSTSTPTNTPTSTGTLPTATNSPTNTSTSTPTFTPTITFTRTATSTPTATWTYTGGPMTTSTLEYWWTQTATFATTATNTPTLTTTSTPTNTPTLAGTAATATNSPTETPTTNCCQAAVAWTTPALTAAAGVAVDMSRHRVYAPDRGDSGTGAIYAYDYNGAPVASFGTNGVVTGLQAFSVATGNCAYDGVYLVQRSPSGHVVKLDANGNVVWTSPSGLGGGTNRSVYVDASGTVYVCVDDGTIYLLDSTGALRNTLTGYGFNAPTGTLKVGSTLFVDDTVNNRVVSLPQTGTYTYGTMSVVATPTSPYVITADLAGNYYVASSNYNGYFIYNSGWTLLSSCANGGLLAGAFGIAVDETGAIYVAGQLSSTVAKMQACISQPAQPTCPPTATPTGTWYTSTPTSTPTNSPTSTYFVVNTYTNTPTVTTTVFTSTNTPTLTSTSSPTATVTGTQTVSCGAQTIVNFTGNLSSQQRADQSGGILQLGTLSSPLLPFRAMNPSLNSSFAQVIAWNGGSAIQQLNPLGTTLDSSSNALPHHAQGLMMSGENMPTAQGNGTTSYAWNQGSSFPTAYALSKSVIDSKGATRQFEILLYQVNDLGTAGINANPPAQVIYAWYAFETTGGQQPSNSNLIGGTGIFEGNQGNPPYPSFDRCVFSDEYWGDFLYFNPDGSLASEGGIRVSGGIGTQIKPFLYLPISGGSGEFVVELNFGTAGIPGYGLTDGLTCYPAATPTYTSTFTYTNTPTYTATKSPTFTNTLPPGTNTPTPLSTNTPTFSYTPTPSYTATFTYTPTYTLTNTNTPTNTLPPGTNTPTPAATNTFTPSYTSTWTYTFTPTLSPTPVIMPVQTGTPVPCSCSCLPGTSNVTVIYVILNNPSTTVINLTNVTLTESGTGDPSTSIVNLWLNANNAPVAPTTFSGPTANFNVNLTLPASGSLTLTVNVNFSGSAPAGNNYQFSLTGLTGSNGQPVNFTSLPSTGADITLSNPSPTPSYTPTFTYTNTASYTATNTPNFTNTLPPGTNTPTPQPTNTFTFTYTPTFTATNTFIYTDTFTPTNTATPTATLPLGTNTPTPQATNTYTSTYSPTNTYTYTSTFSYTPTYSYTPTATLPPGTNTATPQP